LCPNFGEEGQHWSDFVLSHVLVVCIAMIQAIQAIKELP
jgi:hypothetical protein